MRQITGICTALLLLFATVAAFPQEPQPEKEKRKPAQEEPRKPATPAEKEKPPTTPPSKPKASEKPKQSEKNEKKEKASSGQASSERTKHGGRRIPDPQFQSSFRRQHSFHVKRTGDRRFQSGGFVFEVVEVWPADWIFDDECYIDFIDDDYYLIDVVHPERRIVVAVVD